MNYVPLIVTFTLCTLSEAFDQQNGLLISALQGLPGHFENIRQKRHGVGGILGGVGDLVGGILHGVSDVVHPGAHDHISYYPDPWNRPVYGSIHGPGYGPVYAPGFDPGYGPIYGPSFGPGYAPNYGPGYGPGYAPGYGAGNGPGYALGYGPGYGSGYGPGIGNGPGYSPGNGPNYSRGYDPNNGQKPTSRPIYTYENGAFVNTGQSTSEGSGDGSSQIQYRTYEPQGSQ